MPISSQPKEDQALVQRVLDCMETAEPNHKRWRNKANHHFALYNNYNDFRTALADTRPRGTDDVWRDGQSTWGSDLFVPACFATVEATLPLVLSNRPRMVATARDMSSDPNVPNVQTILEAQLEAMRYELTLEEVVKTALIYGLGVQRTYWDTCYRTRTKLMPTEQRASANPGGYQQQTTLEMTYDDPRVESIDPFDFFWDPHARDVQTAGYVVERQWRSMDWIARKFQTGWRNGEDLELVAGMGGEVRYSETWNERLKALGYSNLVTRGPHRPHEILRYHNGEQFIVILDRELCVDSGENPDWHGEIPYDIYRPTPVPGRFEGKGLIEPLEGLQQELNELRRDRRDNARLIINKCFAFTAGMVDTDDFKFGPGLGIPVDGDPRELLMPIQMGDIPYAGYQEETALQSDIKFTGGLSDADMGGGTAPQQTATGAQLVYSATSRRAALMTRRAEAELLTSAAHKITELNQQHVLENRDVQQPIPPSPGQPDRRWSWVTLGPGDLAGDFAWSIEGTMGAENTPQERADGQALHTMFAGDPNVEQQALFAEVLKRYGIRNPAALLAAPEARPPAAVLGIIAQALIKRGASPEEAQAIVGESLQIAVAEEQQGSPGGEVPAAPPPPPEPAASQPSDGGPQQ